MNVKISSTAIETYGSGGGYANSGRGGGRIMIQSLQSYVLLNSTAQLLAEGTQAVSSHFGAGSGGSITVVARSIYGSGMISVQGGHSQSIESGAGGGGRITMQVDILSSLSYNMSFQYHIYISTCN